MRIRFLTPKSQEDLPYSHPGLKNNWKFYYMPPWSLIYHLLELFCLFCFYFFVTTPTIDFCFLNRQVFVDAFYPDYDYPDEPITTLDEITDYFESVVESIDSFITDSFMDIYISTRYLDESVNRRVKNIIKNNNHSGEIDWPILCEILFLNGTKIYQPLDLDEMEFDLQFFYHLSSITISLDFYVFSKSPNVQGCSRWQIQSEIYADEGFSQFSIIPSIDRIQCNNSFIATKAQMKKFSQKIKQLELKIKNETASLKNQENQEKSRKKPHRSINPSFKKEISKIKKRRMKRKTKKTPKYKKHYNLHLKQKDPSINKSIFNLKPKDIMNIDKFYIQKSKNKFQDDDDHIIYQNSLKIYRTTKHLSIILSATSFLHLIIMCCRFRSQFKKHIELTVTNNDYRQIPTIAQFHYTIGFWPMIDFISTIVVLSSSIYLFYDTFSMTQFPSQGAIEFMSAGMFISFIRFNQWFGSYLPFYQLIIILREAFMRLFYLVVSILPIVTGLSLFGIFIFGFIEDSYQTFRYLVQRMITSGMGDSIDDFFIITDDSTDFTAWLSFFYVGIITALGMWIVFTSCIATVSYVHHNSILNKDANLRSDSAITVVETHESSN